MADAASVSIQATVLPDEIAKTFAGTMTVTPDDANDKWYYKLTSVTTTSADLIAGNFLDYTAVDQDTAPTAVATADKVKFLFVKNTSTADGIVISIDAGTAAFNLADGILYVGYSDKDEKIINKHIVFKDKIGRLRDVDVNSNGEIFIITDELDSSIWKLTSNQ